MAYDCPANPTPAERQPDDADLFRSWNWQLCNEFGFALSTTTSSSSFASLKYVTRDTALASIGCHDKYGISRAQVEANVKATNAKYGGWDIDVENVIFTSGAVDPWAGLCLTKKPKNAKSRVAVMQGARHYEDREVSSTQGLVMEGVQKVKAAIRDFLKNDKAVTGTSTTKAPGLAA